MEALGDGHLFFNAGVVGVSFFFVLSGFILTYNYAAAFGDGVSASNYRRFVWDRLTKIYPVHFFALMMILPIAMYSPNLPFDWRALPFHVLLLQCFWPLSNPTFYNYLNVPSWSISCEWFFYLLAPVAIFFALGRIRRWVPVAVAAGYAYGLFLLLRNSATDSSQLYLVSWFAPSRMLEFLAGVFLARVFVSTQALKPLTIGVAQMAGIGLIIAGAFYRKFAPWPFWGGLLYVPGSSLLILGLAHGRGFLVGHLSRPWLLRLGTASFSLYMIHAPILRAMKGVWYHFGWEVRSWSGFSAVTVGMFMLVQTAALILCYAYEIPLQKRLRGWLKTTPTASSVQMRHRVAAAD
jgi:peptidoglycan/LPS O-acetylase OafA/YrhL